jgi:excisionase family DNA binding protein
MAEAVRDLLGTDEAAEYLGVGPVTIHRWCRDGRLPCVKLGKVWRIRRSAIEDYLRRHERSRTLPGQLGSFLQVPDHVIAVAEDARTLRRLDAAFFQVADARGGSLVKFYAGETASPDELRAEFATNGLEAGRLEGEGRLRFAEEPGPVGRRADALRRMLGERAGEGRTLWASFDWVEAADVELALREQEELVRIFEGGQGVVKTAALREAEAGWPAEVQERLQRAHGGSIRLSRGRLWLARAVDLPGG